MLRLCVKELAEEQGYNMSTLSRASDVSFTTVKRFFRKPYSFANTETLEKIALTLGVEIGALVERVPDDDEPLPVKEDVPRKKTKKTKNTRKPEMP
jgi:DNA-binding Xre family transcriptional regulator